MSQSLQGHYAGFVSRLLAYAVDLAILVITIVVITWVINTTIELFPFTTTVELPDAIVLIVAGLTILLFVSGYYVFFWSLAGQTPGKLLLGIRIVRVDGRRLSFRRSLLRFLGYIVSFLVFYLGFLWILMDNRRQGWHDKIADTCVVYAWEARLGDFYSDEIQQQQPEQQSPE
jgi:uncharacterized RDD family membrane protein YckC